MQIYLIKFTAVAVASMVLPGCIASLPTGNNSLRKVDVVEAFSYERQAAQPNKPLSEIPDNATFVQPSNKSEKCLLPSSKDQMERRNFKAYWDGECKDGYAFGLGRDIAISDTHHFEEIVNHKEQSSNKRAGSSVFIDYVQNFIGYTVKTEDAKTLQFTQSYAPNGNMINAENIYRVINEDGEIFESYNYLYNPSKISITINNGVAYRLIDKTALPVTDFNQPIVTLETLDIKTKKQIGFAIAKYPNGFVRHIKVHDSLMENVQLPEEYTKHMESIIYRNQSQLSSNMGQLESARKMESEYLYFACNGKYSVNGLDANVATKICTWRDSLKPKMEASEKHYLQLMSEQKSKADDLVRRLNQQQQQEYQSRLQQQQQNQIQMQQLSQSLANFGQQMQNSGQQMLNSVSNMPAPQAAPIYQPRNNTINCITAGIVTNCKY